MPDLSLTTSDNESGQMLAGNHANFILAPGVSSSGGTEAQHAHRHRHAADRHDPGHRNEQRRLGVRHRRPDRDVHVHAGIGDRGRNCLAEYHDSGDAVVDV